MSQSIVPRLSRAEVMGILGDNLLVSIGLFTNDLAIDDELTFADVVEPVFGGYAPQNVGHWTPGTDVGGVGVIWGDPVWWTWDGLGAIPTVRGYYARQSPAGGLLWVWKAAAAFTFDPVTGLTLLVVPRLNLRRVAA